MVARRGVYAAWLAVVLVLAVAVACVEAKSSSQKRQAKVWRVCARRLYVRA